MQQCLTVLPVGRTVRSAATVIRVQVASTGGRQLSCCAAEANVIAVRTTGSPEALGGVKKKPVAGSTALTPLTSTITAIM